MSKHLWVVGVTLTVLCCLGGQVALAQTTLNPEADSEVRSYTYADTNYGTATTMYIREQAGEGTKNRAVLRFDLSSISGTVTDAKLRLYVNTAPASNVTHRLYFMSDDSWVETTITWNNCPSTTSTSTTWSVTTSDASTWKEMDVTGLVAQEAAGDDKLSVLVMSDTVAAVLPQYRSRDYTGTTYDPQLVVTVSSNEPPTANAGSDQTVTDTDGNGSETVTLDGSASSDSDGTIVSYVWKEGTTQLATGSTAQVSFAVGTHTVTLTVTDDDSDTASDSVSIDVNAKPVANAGQDQNVTDTDQTGSETVTLNGSASSDSDGTITSYVWKEGTTQLATGSTASVSFAVGTHTVTLTVTDDDSASDSDTLTVTVNSGGTSETTLNPEADSEVRSNSYADTNYGTAITLYVREQSGGGTCNRAVFRFDLSSISGTVTNAKLRLYVHAAPASNVTHRLYTMGSDSWVETTITWNNCPSTTSTLTTWSVTTSDANAWKEIDVTSLVAQEAAGDDKLSVQVRSDTVASVLPQYRSRDYSGTTTDPQLVVTTGGGGNNAPVANAGSDQLVHDTDRNGSQAVTLNGSASSDSDGTITSYVWKEGTTQLATGSTASVNLAVGTHTVTLVVTDDDSATASDTMQAEVNTPPVAEAGNNQTVTDGDSSGSETVTLNGSASSDSDGTVTSYVWKEGTTQLATGSTASVSFAVGTHTVTLTVTDNDSATDSDAVIITVNLPSGNNPPVAVAGDDQIVTDSDDNGSETVTVSAAGSSDSDGTIQSYVWKEGTSQLATGSTVQLTLAADQPGVTRHDIGLIVTDDDGATDLDVVRVAIVPKPDRYVDTGHANASDSNAGTSENYPWKTITKAATTATAGQVVLIREGVYREAASVKVSNSGTSGSPIQFIGMPGERVQINGANVYSSWSTCSQNDVRGNPNYQKIYKATYSGSWPLGIFVDGTRQQKASFPNEHRSAYPLESGDSTHIVDSVYLTQPSGFWQGATISVHSNSYQDWASPRIVTAYDPDTHTLTVDGTIDAAWTPVEDDQYRIENVVTIIDAPGDYAMDTATNTIYLWPSTDDNPNNHLVEGSRRDGMHALMSWQANVGYLVFDGLEAAYGLCGGFGARTDNGHDIVIQYCIAHDNNNAGGGAFELLGPCSNITFKRCLCYRNNDNGFSFSNGGDPPENPVADVRVEECFIYKNRVDGFYTGPNVDGMELVRNAVVDHIQDNHPDGFQGYVNVDNVLLDSNLIMNADQFHQLSDVDNATWTNNMMVGAHLNALLLGETNGGCQYAVIEHNTLAVIGNGTVNLCSYSEFYYNIVAPAKSVSLISGWAAWTSDYNLFWETVGSGNYFKWYNSSLTTFANYKSVSGQDANSVYAAPKFTNAPVWCQYADVNDCPWYRTDLNGNTTTKLYLVKIESGDFAVGDHIEVDLDGVVRTVQSVDTTEDYITFTPALDARPQTPDFMVINWKDNDNFAYDLGLTSDSPGKGMCPGGTDPGSNINIQQYLQGDFNGDGLRDVPEEP